MSAPPESTSAVPARTAALPPWRRAEWLIAFTAVLASALGFGWTLGGYFLGDDFGYVGRFYEYPLAQWPRLFAESWAGNMWGFQLRELRPVTALSFMVDARLWQENAFGFRLTNLVLHAAGSTMVGWLAWRATQRELICGLAAAALFALHPVHAEPVQWITGRVDLLATTLYLAGIVVFLRYREGGGRRWLIALGFVYAAAAFAKEFGLTLPIMLLVADALWRPANARARWSTSRAWLPYAAALAVVVVYYFCRRAAFGPGGMGAAPPDPLNPEFQKLFAQRQLVYLGHLLPGVERWWFEGAPLLKDNARGIFLLTAAAAATLFVLWRWAARHRPVEERRASLFFGLGWYLVATLPLVVTYISPRHLYLASAGLCVALALALRALLPWRAAFGVAVVALLAVFAQRLSLTMRPWNEAAALSGTIAREVRALEPRIAPGGALLLDVPEIHNGAYVWTWAVPFALRPPFTRTRLDERAVVLESRGLYVDWERWHVQPAVEKLQRVETESWVLHLTAEGKPPRQIKVAPEKLRTAAVRFAAGPAKDKPHETWRQLIDDAIAP